eukprot:c40417_g1_i1.p3 GENE.c40417_g1_i1~~c40417_g1_i1.p3  ORF type:complete len:123 (-),score=19.92 c40417_g1_i1:52-420(-)
MGQNFWTFFTSPAVNCQCRPTVGRSPSRLASLVLHRLNGPGGKDDGLASAVASAVATATAGLQAENTRLRAELDAFDPKFFAEIDELKFAYKRASTVAGQYERQLADLSRQHGVPFTPLALG